MKEKALALLTCIFIALSILGFAYAQWNDMITISSTLQFGTWSEAIRFVEPKECSDNEATKDVGQFNCYYTGEDPEPGYYRRLVIQMSNAYPSYAVRCSFTLKNIDLGITSKIVDVYIYDDSGELNWIWTTEHTEGFLWKDFNGNGGYDPGEEIMDITITELVDLTLDPEQTIVAEITVHIADNAEECHLYGFQVEIVYERV